MQGSHKSVHLAIIFGIALHAQGVLARTHSELKILLEHIPDHLDYTNSKLDWASQVHVNLAEGLLSANATGELIPGQSERWSISKDGLQYHFKLRENIYWSDGEPVVANDFVRSWQRMLRPKKGNYNSALLHPLKNFREVANGTKSPSELGVIAVNEKLLSITLSTPTGHFLKILQSHKLAPIPSHYPPEQIDQMLTGSANNLVVNGPYSLERLSEEKVYLYKNELYWDKNRIHYDRIKFLKADNSNGKTAIKSVIYGEVDISISRSQKELKWIESMHPQFLQERPSLSTEFYLFNSDSDELIKHADVREALSMAIDRDTLSQRIFKGSVAPTYNLTPSSLFTVLPPPFPDWAKLDYSKRLEKAAGILRRRGITQRTPISIELKTQKYNDRYRFALAVKNAWSQLGVNAKIILQDTPETYKHLSQRKFQAARAGWLADYPDPYDFLYILGSKERKHFLGIPKNPEIDKLLSNSLETINHIEREVIFKEIEELNHKHSLLIPLYNWREYVLRAPTIQGVGEAPFITSLRWARPAL